MKYFLIPFVSFLTMNLNVLAQSDMDTNVLKFSTPFQVDSSEYYIAGKPIFYPSEIYDLSLNHATQNQPYGFSNLYFINLKSRSALKAFNINPIFIYHISGGDLRYRWSFRNGYGPESLVLPDIIILAVITDEYNHDGVINDDDPLSLYVCSKDFKHLKKITPSDLNVVDLSISKDAKSAIVIGNKDANGDKKFKKESDTMFVINLNQEIDKLMLEEVKLK